MTTTQAATILYSCPAYDVVEGTLERYSADPCVVLTDGVELANADKPMRHYMIGSVVSSCMKRGDCPIDAVERAKGFGHDLHFIFALGSCISLHKQARTTYVGVRVGQRVKFEGRYFEIVAQANDNLGLKQIA